MSESNATSSVPQKRNPEEVEFRAFARNIIQGRMGGPGGWGVWLATLVGAILPVWIVAQTYQKILPKGEYPVILLGIPLILCGAGAGIFTCWLLYLHRKKKGPLVVAPREAFDKMVTRMVRGRATKAAAKIGKALGTEPLAFDRSGVEALERYLTEVVPNLSSEERSDALDAAGVFLGQCLVDSSPRVFWLETNEGGVVGASLAEAVDPHEVVGRFAEAKPSGELLRLFERMQDDGKENA